MKTQVVAIHGADAFDSYEDYIQSLEKEKLDFSRLTKKDWKANLEKDLGKDYEVILPQMPNKKNAKYVEWKIWFDKIIPFLHEGCVLIGHSMGGIFFGQIFFRERYWHKAERIVSSCGSI